MVDKVAEQTQRVKKPSGPKKEKGLFTRFIEGLIGKAKQAKESVGTKGLTPILSLEARVTIPKLRKLIQQIGERVVPQLLPSLQEKNVLEIGEGPLAFQKIILEKKPKMFCGAVIGGVLPTTGGEAPPWAVKTSIRSIPFDQQFFDGVVASLTTPLQGDVISVIKEIGRMLLPDGFALLIDFHPFGMYARSGSERIRSPMATIRGLEDYFRMCKLAGLSVVDLYEGFLDDTLRNQFTTNEEMNTFRDLKGTPLVLYIIVTKSRKAAR